MTSVERSIYIDATTDEIDAIALDLWRLPEWFAGVEGVEPDDVYPEPGGRVNMVYKAGGATLNLQMIMLELERGSYALYRIDGMMTDTTTWKHTPEGEGTRLTSIFEYELPGGGLGKAVDKLLVERMNVKNLEDSLSNLKALVEGG